MSTDELACVIFIALEEEAEVFRESERLHYGKAISQNGYTIFPFEFRDRNEIDQTGHLVVFGEMGPSRAGSVSERVLARYNYRYAISIGISGQLSRDMRIGDTIFVTDEVFDYSNRAKAIDREKEEPFEFRPGSRGFPIDETISELGRSLRRSEPTLFAQWKAFCQEHYAHLIREMGATALLEIKARLGQNAINDAPRLVAGPVASGPIVGKAQGFRELITQTNPNVLALDMETAAIARACQDHRRASLIALRGISDPVRDKQLVDELSGGGFRRYAMLAASRLAGLLIRNVLEFKLAPAIEPQNEVPTASAAAPIEPQADVAAQIFADVEAFHVAPTALGAEIADPAALESLFELCTKQKMPRSREGQPLSIQGIVAKLPSLGPESTVWISGPPGVGKSLLARSLWRRLADDFSADRSNLLPIYINLGARERELYRKLKMPMQDAIISIVEQDDARLFKHLPEKSELLLIVDGFEERHTFKDPLLKRYHRTIFRRFPNRRTVLVIDRTTLPSKASAEALQDSNLDSPIFEVGVRAVRTDAPGCRAFVEAFLGALRQRGSWSSTPAAVDRLLKIAETLDVRELDLFTLRTLVEASQRANFAQMANISVLFLDALAAKMRENFDREDDYNSDDNHIVSERFYRSLCAISFDILTHSTPFHLVQAEQRKSGLVDTTRLEALLEANSVPITASHLALALEGYAILRAHPLFVAVTLADHVLRCLEVEAGAEGPRGYDALKFVYPTSINRAFKHLMATGEARETAVLKSAAIILADADAPELARAHAAYLLGRAISRNAQAFARGILSEALTSLRLDGDPPLQSERLGHAVNARSRLFRRGVLISLAYLGDQDAAIEYVTKVLADHVEDAVNRGFHLEYYGDVPFTPEDGLTHLDDLTHSGRKTIRELDKRIRHAVGQIEVQPDVAPSPNLLIDIATFCSIVQHRHIRGKLDAGAVDSAKALLDLLIAHRAAMHPVLRTYVAMVRRNLEAATFREGDLLRMFYRLKREERAGWVKRRALGKLVGDVRIESVADHSFMAAIIAYFYLPEWTERLGAPYKKDVVIETLLIHDLCESFVGDHAKGEGYDEEIEELWGMYIQRLATYEKIHGAKRFWTRYKEFYDGSTHEARIASDIDKIENLVQLYEYQDLIDRDAFDAFETGLIIDIHTEPGIYVRQTLQSLRDTRHGLDAVQAFPVFR